MCDYIFVIKFRWPLAVRSCANRKIRVRQVVSTFRFSFHCTINRPFKTLIDQSIVHTHYLLYHNISICQGGEFGTKFAGCFLKKVPPVFGPLSTPNLQKSHK